MKKIVASGKTIEDAVHNGITELQVPADRVRVTVLAQPSKGLFGLFGAKPAKVELELLPELAASTDQEQPVTPVLPVAAREEGDAAASESSDPIAEAIRFITDVAETMGLQSVTVKRSHSRDGHVLTIFGEGEVGMLIGRRGQTLDALQYLASIVANRYSSSHLRIVLDAEDFRERRRKTLQELSDRLAGQVIRTRKEVVLEPMPPQERKVIHAQLQNHAKVKTFSKGDEPNRRVVITLK